MREQVRTCGELWLREHYKIICMQLHLRIHAYALRSLQKYITTIDFGALTYEPELEVGNALGKIQ